MEQNSIEIADGKALADAVASLADAVAADFDFKPLFVILYKTVIILVRGLQGLGIRRFRLQVLALSYLQSSVYTVNCCPTLLPNRGGSQTLTVRALRR